MKHIYCERPNLIAMYRALERRLPQQHPMLEKVQTQLKREIAGEKGQQALKFPLSFRFTLTSLPTILHNLRLEDENGFFEIDALLICEQFIVLLEAKNWYGTLYVDGERQVIRVGDDNMEEGMPNPFSQVKLQKHRLQKWLLRHFSEIELPIFYYIVLGFPTTIVKAFNPTQEIPGQLIHSHEIPWKLQMLIEASPAFPASSIDIDHMIKKLLAAHVPNPINILERFSLTVQDLIKGVFCSKCHFPKMNKSQKGWLCTECQHLSKDAHIQTLLDFQLLLGKRITNQQARGFLNMDSSHAVKRILQKAGSAVGRTRARVYELNLQSVLKALERQTKALNDTVKALKLRGEALNSRSEMLNLDPEADPLSRALKLRTKALNETINQLKPRGEALNRMPKALKL